MSEWWRRRCLLVWCPPSIKKNSAVFCAPGKYNFIAEQQPTPTKIHRKEVNKKLQNTVTAIGTIKSRHPPMALVNPFLIHHHQKSVLHDMPSSRIRSSRLVDDVCQSPAGWQRGTWSSTTYLYNSLSPPPVLVNQRIRHRFQCFRHSFIKGG